MRGYIKELHTIIFTGSKGCGKSHPVLDLIEKEYSKHFDYIIIICPTLRWNKIYHAKGWIKHADKVWLTEPKDKLYQWVEKLSKVLARSETLFIIADESLDKRRQSLLKLAISGRHCHHYLWLLTQSYSALPKNLRRQAKAIFFWYPKERADLKMIHDENHVLTDDELVIVKDFLKTSKHACLYIRNEHPCGFRFSQIDSLNVVVFRSF